MTDAPKNDEFLRDAMIGGFMTFDIFYQVCILHNLIHFMCPIKNNQTKPIIVSLFHFTTTNKFSIKGYS